MKKPGKIDDLLRAASREQPDVDEPTRSVVVDKDPSRYRDRVLALPAAAAILGKTALIAGLGSVGSEIGARLVRLGARVVGCDPDVLRVENLIRWGLPASIEHHAGAPKALVWQEMLEATVPGARVAGHVLDVVQQATSFDALVAATRPDLLIAATDTADSRRMVNAMAARHGVPALFVGLADGAASVRVEVVEDARGGPCHLCATVAEGGRGGTADPGARSRTPYATDRQEEGDARAVPALPIDVALGALIAARIALRMLAGEDFQTLLRNGDQKGNVLFLSLQPGWWVFEDAWDRFVYQVERDPDCPACGHATASPTSGDSGLLVRPGDSP